MVEPDAERITRAIERWFRANARPLPWRPDPIDGPRDPYRALVSELMLQQTQVSRVIEKYDAFLARFPSARALADAPESEVLAAWSGLGYYRRARLLHAAARAIVERHNAVVPDDAGALRDLPGVGRYTAGAIASMVFGRREPIVDGNVERVLLRLGANDAPPKDKATQSWLWDRAGELVRASDSPGVCNEALMELGATVCTPGTPSCDACPLRSMCAAHGTGRAATIPTPKPRAVQKPWHIACFVVERDGLLLTETRPPEGLWAGMLQPVSAEGARAIDAERAARSLGVRIEAETDRFVHTTTHRSIEIVVYRAGLAADRPGASWASRDELAGMAISNAHRRVFGLVGTAPTLFSNV